MTCRSPASSGITCWDCGVCASHITHAHWHVVPVAGQEIITARTADGLLPTSLETISDIASWSDSAYFLVMYGDRKLVVHAEPRLRRQYLRSVISKPLKIPDPEWDYAVVVRKEYLRENHRAGQRVDPDRATGRPSSFARGSPRRTTARCTAVPAGRRFTWSGYDNVSSVRRGGL